MSDVNLARRTDAEVFFAGVNISRSLRKYLMSISYIDNEEDEADDLQIEIEDRDDVWLTSWLQKAIEAAASANLSGSKDTTTYKVKAKSGVNIRSGGGTKYKKLGKLAHGAEVEVIVISNGWASIVHGAGAAFVEAKQLTTTGTGSSKKASKYAQVSYGSKGADVKTMQTLLISLGYNVGPKGANGKFGSKTRTAVIQFQKDQKLPGKLGYFGPNSWTALLKATQKKKAADRASKGLRIQAGFVRQNWNGDGADIVLDCGEFELDSVSSSGPPSIITFKATSLPYRNSVRQTKKSKAWENYTLSGIANEIAGKSGMACMYESAHNPAYTRLEQLTESDISFLSRLCHNAGISLKVTNNIIVLFDQRAYETKPAVLTIKRGKSGGYTKWKINTGKADTQYAMCRVSYTNPATGKLIEGIAYSDNYDANKDDNQCLEITAAVKSIGEAKELAEKRLRLHNKYEYKAVFTFPGNPDLLAGNTAVLSGWGAWDGKYIIKQAKHKVDASGGYETQITLRRALEGY